MTYNLSLQSESRNNRPESHRNHNPLNQCDFSRSLSDLHGNLDAGEHYEDTEHLYNTEVALSRQHEELLHQLRGEQALF
jgi:hypothetical protein